jgi:predicted transcriptional regulator
MEDPRRAEYQAGWDAQLTPLLTDEWQSADALALKLNAKQATVLERLKDMMRRNLAERRIVEKPRPPARPSKKKRSKRRMNLYSAEFRRVQAKASEPNP